MAADDELGIVGQCLDMCPSTERRQREKDRLLHKFELLDNTAGASGKADPLKCVKQFSRSAAGQAPPKSSEIRPPAVLQKTVDYLLSKILTRESEAWSYVYEFIFDRLRAVRQDIVVQVLWNAECTEIYECIARFHIYSIYKLWGHPVSEFDPHINGTHLQEVLKRLLVCYMEMPNLSPSRCEMEAYYLLYNLGSNDAVRHALDLPKSLRTNKLIHLSLQIQFAWMNGNVVKLFHCVMQLPFLHCVTLLPHLGKIHRYSLQVMNTGYSVKNCKYPLKLLTKNLLFDSDLETRRACTYYGINVAGEFVLFFKPNFKGNLPVREKIQWKFLKEKHETITLPEVFYQCFMTSVCAPKSV